VLPSAANLFYPWTGNYTKYGILCTFSYDNSYS
jgi:hypothetical protein